MVKVKSKIKPKIMGVRWRLKVAVLLVILRYNEGVPFSDATAHRSFFQLHSLMTAPIIMIIIIFLLLLNRTHSTMKKENKIQNNE